MNNLSRDKKIAVLSMMVEGSSVRSIERVTQVHRDTALRLMGRVGAGCDRLMDGMMRDLPCTHVEIDELWGYTAKKQRHLLPTDDPRRVGDTWTFLALCADSKAIPVYRVGKRDLPTATDFLCDLSTRLSNRVQLSSDSLATYVEAVERAWGTEVDYGQIVKSYEAEPMGPGRYSPPHVVSAQRFVVAGNPDPSRISTSYIERANLSVRMGNRRLTRLTNAFSKKIENFKASMGLWVASYNLCKIHRTIRATPAMELGVASRIWSIGDLLDATESN